MRKLRIHTPCFALAAVLLCLCGHLSAVVHFAVVHHELCLQHGEFVHADPSHLERHLLSSASDHVLPDAMQISLEEIEQEDVHDHCAMALHGHGRMAILRVDTQIAARPPPQHLVAFSQEQYPFSDRFILSRAPKNSPPLI